MDVKNVFSQLAIRGNKSYSRLKNATTIIYQAQASDH